MRNALQVIAAIIPLALLVLVYTADSYREPLYTTPLFFGLLEARVGDGRGP